MSVELTRRMVQAGVVAEAEALVLLHDALREQRPLLGLLAERAPALAEQVEREVTGAAAGPFPDADPTLVARLPPGLCQRLLAVPLALEPGGVVVLVADGLDEHAARELAHALGQPLARVVVASARGVLASLVGAGGAGSARAPSVAPAPPSAPPPRRAPVASTPDQHPLSPEAAEAVRAELERAPDPEAVVQALARGLEGVCQGVLVLVLRGNAYEARAGGGPEHRAAERAGGDLGAHAAALRALRLPADDPTVVAAASNLGSLGALPWAGPWALVREVLGVEGAADAYLTVVPVEERPLLLIVGAGFEGAYEASRAIDDLGRSAGAALLRLLRERRRPSP